MFNRLEKIINKNNLNRLQQQSIMVVGIGGVGGYAVESLVRSGIGHIILVDSDVVDITNKNRQIIALDSTIGMKKVEVMKNRILDINQDCRVDIEDIFLDASNINSVLNKYSLNYVIDACDTISTKKELIKYCLNSAIPFISSMGTGNKLDCSKLKINDIRKTSYDPLAKIIRKWVKDERIVGDIPVLWSDEAVISTGDRIPDSTSFVPGCAGLMIVGYVIRKIIKK